MKLFINNIATFENCTRVDTKNKKLKLFRQLQQFCSTYSTQSLPYKKSWWKVQVNVVTPQELGVCGESNEKKW